MMEYVEIKSPDHGIEKKAFPIFWWLLKRHVEKEPYKTTSIIFDLSQNHENPCDIWDVSEISIAELVMLTVLAIDHDHLWIFMVDLPIQNGGVPIRFLYVDQRVPSGK